MKLVCVGVIADVSTLASGVTEEDAGLGARLKFMVGIRFKPGKAEAAKRA